VGKTEGRETGTRKELQIKNPARDSSSDYSSRGNRRTNFPGIKGGKEAFGSKQRRGEKLVGGHERRRAQ